MIFLQIPPNTSNYMIAGYAVIFTVLLVYLATIVLRFRNMHRDIELLEDLDRQENDNLPRSERAAAAPGDNPSPVRK
ncbi:MAG: CcmD family protein [Chloroflexi bacterium]|nr:MAG: CcmD family protein [Chloroflexota bacterium]